jgi:hypothetical protein
MVHREYRAVTARPNGHLPASTDVAKAIEKAKHIVDGHYRALEPTSPYRIREENWR